MRLAVARNTRFSCTGCRCPPHPITAADTDLMQSLVRLDFTTVVAILLSFLAIVLGYDAICGERERGTLQLLLANSVPRSTVVLGKLIGGLLSMNRHSSNFSSKTGSCGTNTMASSRRGRTRIHDPMIATSRACRPKGGSDMIATSRACRPKGGCDIIILWRTSGRRVAMASP